MKLLLCFFLIPTAVIAQQNRPSTDEEVLAFIKSLSQHKEWIRFPSDYDIQNFKDCLSKDEIKIWEYADVTNDGRDDLLVNLYSGFPIVVVNWMPKLDSTNSEIHDFLSDPLVSFNFSDECDYIQSDQINGIKTILYSGSRDFLTIDSKGRKSYERRLFHDSLVYRFGGFIEYNGTPSSKQVKSIKFIGEGCWSQCPEFELIINNKGKTIFKPRKYLDGLDQKRYVYQLEMKEFDSLENLIKYIEVEKLNEEYAISWNHQQSIILMIRFTDGTSKKILDYGLKGTRGLSLLYDQLYYQIRVNE